MSTKLHLETGNHVKWAENLAAAIILQAVEDYRLAAKRIRNNPTYEGLIEESRKQIVLCELFFRSDWFAHLTTIDPEALIKQLRSEKMSVNVQWRM